MAIIISAVWLYLRGPPSAVFHVRRGALANRNGYAHQVEHRRAIHIVPLNVHRSELAVALLRARDSVMPHIRRLWVWREAERLVERAYKLRQIRL